MSYVHAEPQAPDERKAIGLNPVYSEKKGIGEVTAGISWWSWWSRLFAPAFAGRLPGQTSRRFCPRCRSGIPGLVLTGATPGQGLRHKPIYRSSWADVEPGQGIHQSGLLKTCKIPSKTAPPNAPALSEMVVQYVLSPRGSISPIFIPCTTRIWERSIPRNTPLISA